MIDILVRLADLANNLQQGADGEQTIRNAIEEINELRNAQRFTHTHLDLACAVVMAYAARVRAWRIMDATPRTDRRPGNENYLRLRQCADDIEEVCQRLYAETERLGVILDGTLPEPDDHRFASMRAMLSAELDPLRDNPANRRGSA